MSKLLEDHVAHVYRFALRLTGDPHAAEDLTQETFLRAWRRQHLLREPRVLRVWLLRIAANLWRDQLRRGRSLVARAGPLVERPDKDQREPVQQAAAQEDLTRALAALDALPPRQREVLYLSASEELSVAEIAAVLEISPDAVKANLSLARKQLRQQLHDLFKTL